MTSPDEIAAMEILALCPRRPHNRQAWFVMAGSAPRSSFDLKYDTSAPITERRYIAPLILVPPYFFLWAWESPQDVSFPHLRRSIDRNDFQSALHSGGILGGYCLSALPAGRLLERIGYKNGIVVGLITCAAGALLCYSRGSIQV